jgi:CRP/FNR family transcriptional regulator
MEHGMTNDEGLIKKYYRLEAGDILSTKLDYLYIVESGSIKHFYITEEGNELVADFYFPGDMIGLESLGSQDRSYHLIALEDTEVCAFPIDSIEQLASKQPEFQENLLNLLSQKIQDRTQALLIQHRHAEQRLANFLLELSKKLKNISHSALDYDLSMSRQEIGNYLHLSTETVSRILSKFQHENLIDVQRKHVVLKDVKGLNEKAFH